MSAETSLAEARAMVEAHFPEVSIERCEPVLGGWDHIMLLVNREWIFRIPRRPECEATLEKEARLLPLLAPSLPLPVPRYEFVWRGGVSPRIVVGYRHIPGVRLGPKVLGGPHGATVAGQIAAFLTALHAFPLQRAASVGVSVGDPTTWRKEYASFFRWVQREAFPALDSRERQWTTDICEDFLGNAANFRFTTALLHRDLAMEHVLYDPASGDVTGVVDWGDASVGDPAFDFAGILADLGESAVRAVLKEYRGPKDAGMMDRACFFANISPFYGIIYGRLLGHPEWFREGLRRLRARVDSPRHVGRRGATANEVRE